MEGTLRDFEHYLSDNGVTIVKFFLHISRAEQARRLRDRLEDPERNWKFTPADIEERRFWDDYQSAYEDVLARSSTSWAPWFVIPSDHKWYRNWAVADILRHTLQKMDIRFPPPLHDARDLLRRLQAQEA